MRSSNSGKHIDIVCMEVSSSLSSVVDSVGPAPGQYVLSCVFIQQDKISLCECQKRGVMPICRKQYTPRVKDQVYCSTLNDLYDVVLPWLWLSVRATTNFDLLRRPFKKVSTRLQMSSALLEVKVYSSPLMLARVKLWPWSFPPLEGRRQVINTGKFWL